MAETGGRNRIGSQTVTFYLIGLVCAVAGVYLSSITRIDLLTGQTASPYLDIGIPLIVVGILVVVFAQRAAKRSLGK